MQQSRECPKCRSTMVDGYIADQGHGTAAVPSWREGEPRKSFWMGLKLGGTSPMEITTWCCRRCGFLENYVVPEDL